MPEKTKTVTTWINRGDAIVATGLTQNVFEQRIRIRIRSTETRTVKRRMEFLVSAVIRAAIEDANDRSRRDATELDDGRFTSPGLERGRNANADMLEMQRDERLRVLVNRFEFTEAITRALVPVKSTVERLQQAHGSTVADIFNKALTEAEETVNKYFSDLADAAAHPPDDPADNSASSDDGAVDASSQTPPADAAVRGGGDRHTGGPVQRPKVSSRSKPVGRRAAKRHR
jgi:hypothetical protein